MEALQQQVQDRKENLEGTNSVLIQGLSYLPGWNEKNFQVWMPPSNPFWQHLRVMKANSVPALLHVCKLLLLH